MLRNYVFTSYCVEELRDCWWSHSCHFRRHNYMFRFHRLVCLVYNLLMFPWYSLSFVTFYSCQERTQYISAWQLKVSHGKQLTRSLTWCWITKSSVCSQNFKYRRRVVLYPTVFYTIELSFEWNFGLYIPIRTKAQKLLFSGRWNFVNRKMFVPKKTSLLEWVGTWCCTFPLDIIIASERTIDTHRS